MHIDRSQGIVSTINFTNLSDSKRNETIPPMLFDMADTMSTEKPRFRFDIYDEAILVFDHYEASLDYISNLFRAAIDMNSFCDYNFPIKAGVCEGYYYISDDQIYGDAVNIATSLCYNSRKNEMLFSCDDSHLVSEYISRHGDLEHYIRDDEDGKYSVSLIDKDMTQTTVGHAKYHLLHKGNVLPSKKERRYELVIGRSSSADFAIDDDRISRKHATIMFSEEFIEVRDHSANGTYVMSDGRLSFLRDSSTRITSDGFIAFSERPAAWDESCLQDENVLFFKLDKDFLEDDDKLNVA